MPGTGRSAYRWVMLALVFSLYVTYGLISSSLAPLVTVVTEELHLSAAQFGTVLGAWQLGYVLVAFWAGILIDRFQLRVALTFGAAVMALSGLVRSQAGGFLSLFLHLRCSGWVHPLFQWVFLSL